MVVVRIINMKIKVSSDNKLRPGRREKMFKDAEEFRNESGFTQRRWSVNGKKSMRDRTGRYSNTKRFKRWKQWNRYRMDFKKRTKNKSNATTPAS